MKNQQKIDKLFMDIAIRVAEESYCIRKKVGAILVKDNSRIISIGYNGTISGEDNSCEETLSDGSLQTKSTVVHAEQNVFRKILKSTESSLGATLYITLQPCENCSGLIIDSGIKRVIFKEEYRCDKGLEKLRKKGIIVEKYNDDTFSTLQYILDQ